MGRLSASAIGELVRVRFYTDPNQNLTDCYRPPNGRSTSNILRIPTTVLRPFHVVPAVAIALVIQHTYNFACGYHDRGPLGRLHAAGSNYQR